jgi:hypothetical protein
MSNCIVNAYIVLPTWKPENVLKWECVGAGKLGGFQIFGIDVMLRPDLVAVLCEGNMAPGWIGSSATDDTRCETEHGAPWLEIRNQQMIADSMRLVRLAHIAKDPSMVFQTLKRGRYFQVGPCDDPTDGDDGDESREASASTNVPDRLCHEPDPSEAMQSDDKPDHRTRVYLRGFFESDPNDVRSTTLIDFVPTRVSPLPLSTYTHCHAIVMQRHTLACIHVHDS